MSQPVCVLHDPFTTTVSLDGLSLHRETGCLKCHRILMDEFLDLPAVVPGADNYTFRVRGLELVTP